MKQILIILTLASFLPGCLSCVEIKLDEREIPVQEQDVPYKTYQAMGNLCRTADGGLATVLLRQASNKSPGSSAFPSPYLERYEVVVVRTSMQGQVLWTKLAYTLANRITNRPLIHPLRDGGYLVFVATDLINLGGAQPSMKPAQIVIRLNSEGEIVDRQVNEAAGLAVGSGLFQPYQLLSMADDGFVVTGRLSTTSGSGTAVILIRFNERGLLQWSRTYPTELFLNNPVGVAATPEGGFVLSWFGRNNQENIDQSFLLKTDASGNQVWSRRYALFAARIISPAADGGYVLLGVLNPSLRSAYLYKMSESGDIQWVRAHPLPEGQSWITPYQLISTSTAYLLVYTAIPTGLHLLTTDLAGAEQSRRTVNVPTLTGSQVEVVRLPDNSFALAGQVLYNSVVLLRANPDGSTQWTTTLASDR
ncbi:hypothetical protein GCM10023187_00580 [Nibrella viscosa]|uniref:Lipoprotein n=1 Tax=Nibrella viscosa TaxID=1084524 RepID=A0ABP8JQN3_9BACT